MDAHELVDKIRQQNWKLGGVHTMDVDKAVEIIESALNSEFERGKLLGRAIGADAAQRKFSETLAGIAQNTTGGLHIKD